MKRIISTMFFVVVVMALQLSFVQAQTTAFTYQGKLTDSGVPANGQYDLTFRLFDLVSGGTQFGPDVVRDNVQITAGIFTVDLDFGSSPFTTGGANNIEISVRPGVSTGAFTLLEPRQPLSSAPYSIRSINTSLADSLSPNCVLCVTDGHIESVAGIKVTGTVASAANAATADNVTGVVAVANGGTGSTTKTFVDLSTDQSNIGGNKTFIGAVKVAGGNGVFNGNGSGLTNIPGTFKWELVSGATQQGQSNTGYAVSNPSEVTITLPQSPNIGDTIRVSAIGQGGWKIAQNPGQSMIGANYDSADHVWSPRETDRSWWAIASSADGTKIVAVVMGGQIYTSTDSGSTWTPRETNRTWISVVSSADGSKLVAAVRDGQLYTSTNSGITWTARESSRFWLSVASSANGTILVAGAGGSTGTGVFVSSDSGVTWQQRGIAQGYSAVAASADGTRLAAGGGGAAIFTSVNSGVTWAVSLNLAESWASITSSADGGTLAAAALGGQIYNSTTGGATWTPRESNRFWTSITSSANGNKMAAVASGGQIYVSSDSGSSWSPRETNRSWGSIASTADGDRLVAVEANGRIYTSERSTTPGINGYLKGGRSASVELQYIGNGQFLPISHEGTIQFN